ncbi:MAG: C39 family peptidase [Meiothermus sp.]|uniref:C39 family peptidase n=1 Tax=Meiothermus sp. TaxID=1955249 RepID=UPI0025FFD900|nr:C39 family peptidase [Meiothermus sp.]MCS7058062.1 C39 family peptidase [Meiothermus sp.]MCS7194966.1 C39 family peptidase [Meiothermus sp.]MDW8091834.1 C39 family peptidase [Meiothermus sp.]MDW8482607.1 C39 family peptidase [Meiothermus sp.]
MLPFWVLWGLGALLAYPAAKAQEALLLRGIRHEYQRFNNCGPATLGMALSYWGRPETQYQIAPVLKPNPNDKNVSPEEMVAYARGLGFGAHQGVAGDWGLLERLLGAGFPVVVETWFVTPDHGGMGHYRLLVGYDRARRVFHALDSYLGPRVLLPYGELDRLWRVFGRTYLVVYPKSHQERLWAVLGERRRVGFEARLAAERAQQEIREGPPSPFPWFNLGSAWLALGRPQDAALAFDRSRRMPPDRGLDPRPVGGGAFGWPWRMLWYQFGPYEAYYRSGRYAEVMALADGVLARAPDHEESLYWRGRARGALGDLRGARADLRAALGYRPGFQEAAAALRTLE